MTPYKQLFGHDPENGIYGDCYRTVIGCLVDVPPDKVPHFSVVNGPETTGDEAWGACKEFLKEYGLISIYVQLLEVDGVQAALDRTAFLWPGIILLFNGTSRNGTNHVVIVKDGKIIHDPSPYETGIVGPLQEGYFTVELIVRPLTDEVEGR